MGGCIMLWGFVPTSGTGNIAQTDGRMNFIEDTEAERNWYPEQSSIKKS